MKEFKRYRQQFGDNMKQPRENYFGPWPRGSFVQELQTLINRHSIEGGSNTPDFILAEYLKQCLEAFDMCVRRRDEWHSPHLKED